MIQEDTENILISWLPEYAYCPRRFYLKTIESSQGENEYTAEGKAEHQVVHRDKIEKRGEIVKVTGLTVWSETLRLYGICDCVEFHENKNGVYIPFLDKKYIITPIEYKHGKERASDVNSIQLATQVMCLEEMYDTSIPYGFLYYIGSKKRCEIQITNELRAKTLETIHNITNMIYQFSSVQDSKLKQEFFQPVYKRRCQKCSVFDICSPKKVMVSQYMNSLWKGVTRDSNS